MPDSEHARLAVLASCQVLDTAQEQAFNDLALLAASICAAPIALVSLVDSDRQWFKASVGLDVRQTPRSLAFCAHAITDPEHLLVVRDATLDPRFADNALVTGEPRIRFYAGAPIVLDGEALGTVCVIDRSPRDLDASQLGSLQVLARQASSELALRRAFLAQERLRLETERIARSLQDSTERMLGVFDSALDAIVSIDDDGRITAFNVAAEQLFGISQADFLGKPMASVIIPPNYRQAHEAGMARFKLTGDARVLGRRIEITACRADGSEFPVELAISHVRTSRGSEFTAYIRDISARKQAEMQLAAARDAAQAASRSKSEFLANMSHEIRTPLNGILGLAELGLDPDCPESPDELLALIHGSASGLLDIVNGILDFSKIESTGVELHPRPFRPRSVIGDAVRMLEPRARRKGLELSYAQDENLPGTLVGDPGVLRQIAFNLVGNAIKFTNSGFVRASLEFDGFAGGKASVRLTVADSGVGIAADQLERIFEAFAQADGSDARPFGGTGLGLAITRRLVHALGGRIEVRSTAGVGSTFVVRLQLDAGEQEKPADAPVPAAELLPFPDGQHVLVLDDNATNRLIAGNWLRKQGYRTTEAETGLEALREVAKDPPDLMLVDIQMPGMSGIEFLQTVRASPGPAAAIPAIALTAHALVGDRERFLGLGMEGYVAKPFTADSLLREVGRVLGLRNRIEPGPPVPVEGRFARALAGLDGDRGMFAVLAARTQEEFANHALRMQEHVALGEWRRVHDLGHKIKGSWEMYARPGDEHLPADLMGALAEGQHERVRALAARLSQALMHAAQDLRDWCRRQEAGR